MEDQDFDLSGLEELNQTEESAPSQEATEAPTTSEAPAVAETAEAPVSTWKVGNTEYQSPEDIVRDYAEMQKAFTKSQQELKRLQEQVTVPAPEAPATPTEAETGLDPQAADQLNKALKALGYVSREELLAEKQAEAQQAQVAQFKNDVEAFAAEKQIDLEELLTYMQENDFAPTMRQVKAAYLEKYQEQILQAKAQELFERKVAPAVTEKPAPGTGHVPPQEASINLDDPESFQAAIAAALNR